MEVKEIIHALRWIASGSDSQTNHHSRRSCSMSLQQKMGWMSRLASSKAPQQSKHPSTCGPGHAGCKENSEQTGETPHTSCLCLGRPEALRSLRNYSRAQNQRHHTTDHWEERGVGKGSSRRSTTSKKNHTLQSPIRPTLTLFDQSGQH